MSFYCSRAASSAEGKFRLWQDTLTPGQRVVSSPRPGSSCCLQNERKTHLGFESYEHDRSIPQTAARGQSNAAGVTSRPREMRIGKTGGREFETALDASPDRAGSALSAARVGLRCSTRTEGLKEPSTMKSLAFSATADEEGKIGETQTECPLTKVQAGTTVRIRRLNVSDELSQRLREIGFFERQVLQLLAHRGNVICQIQNCRMGLGAKLAEEIFVERVSAPG